MQKLLKLYKPLLYLGTQMMGKNVFKKEKRNMEI